MLSSLKLLYDYNATVFYDKIKVQSLKQTADEFLSMKGNPILLSTCKTIYQRLMLGLSQATFTTPRGSPMDKTKVLVVSTKPTTTKEFVKLTQHKYKNSSKMYAMPVKLGDSEQQKESYPREMGGWDSDVLPIVIDSVASRTITPNFSYLIDPKPYKTSLKGIGSGKITHVGTVRWEVQDVDGRDAVLEDNQAYYSKDSPYRLLCPHSWRNGCNQKRYEMGDSEGDGCTMNLDPKDNGGYILTWNRGRTAIHAPIDPTINLPMIFGKPTYKTFSAFTAGFKLPSMEPPT
jgi:hypothetical protein